MHSIERYNFFLLSSLEFPQYAVELVAFPADESISFSVEGESDVDITGIICSVVEDEEEEEGEEEEGEEEEGGEEEEEGSQEEEEEEEGDEEEEEEEEMEEEEEKKEEKKKDLPKKSRMPCMFCTF